MKIGKQETIGKKKTDITSQAVTATQFAKLLRVGKSTITLWKGDGLPVGVDGRINLATGLAWWADRTLAAASGPAGGESLERWRSARAKREELELAKASGKLISVDDADAFWTDRVTVACTQFQGVGQALAPSLVGQDVRAIATRIDNRLRFICEELGREYEAALDEDESRAAEGQGLEMATDSGAE